MCLVCTIPLLLPHAVRTKRKMNLLAVLLCFLILGLTSPSLAIIGQLKRYLAYYPAEVSSLDQELQRRHLVTGIGNYWDSKYITMLSRDTVRILQVRPDLAPFFWINSAKWYEKGQPQFVLIDTSAYAITPPMYRLSESFVRGQFGDPEERFTVSGKVVLVYNRTSDSAFKDLLRK